MVNAFGIPQPVTAAHPILAGTGHFHAEPPIDARVTAPHAHIIREDWPHSLKQLVADHIAHWHPRVHTDGGVE